MTKRYLPLLAVLILTTPAVYAAEAEDARTQGMHAQMQKMREQMAAINSETDPAQRAELMKQHHDDMHASMRMMGESTQGMSMESRMEAVEQHMEMMGMMMEHMMAAHEGAEEPAQTAAPAEPAPTDRDAHNH